MHSTKSISVFDQSYNGTFSRRFSSEKSPTITVASFFRQTFHSSRMYHFLCNIHFYQKYSVLDFERLQSLYLEMQNPEWSTLPIFRRYETFPAPFFGFVRLFFEIFFEVFKGSPFYFFGVLHLNEC